LSEPTALERAVAALRGGRPVAVGAASFVSVETGTAAMLDLLDPGGTAPLVLSGPRAAALGLGNAREAGDLAGPVQIARCGWLDHMAAASLADPALDFARGPTGPLTAEPLDDPRDTAAALALARLAGLLPALWRVAADPAARIAPADIESMALGSAEIVARATLPIDGVGEAQIVAFRDSATGEEHVALLIGAFGGDPPLVRLHSECLTGDVFGSLKCDCGPQLREAIGLIAAQGGGILLYLRQEGRGIGLSNKLRAYQLQDRGLDTVDSNRRLGFADDERDFAIAGAMLRALGVDRIRLLTNNPAKVAGLSAAGVTVVERIAHHMPSNAHNAGYLSTKRERSGHLD
jgi:GTP cyclohydrolase II